MIIRRARAGDVAAMAEVAARSYASAFARILEARTIAARDAAFFAARFATCWRRMRVAACERCIVGFTLVTACHLDMIFLAPEATGRGIGRALLARVEREGARSLECFAANRAARRFYEREGWRLVRAYARDFAGRPRDFVLYAKPRRRRLPRIARAVARSAP